MRDLGWTLWVEFAWNECSNACLRSNIHHTLLNKTVFVYDSFSGCGLKIAWIFPDTNFKLNRFSMNSTRIEPKEMYIKSQATNPSLKGSLVLLYLHWKVFLDNIWVISGTFHIWGYSIFWLRKTSNKANAPYVLFRFHFVEKVTELSKIQRPNFWFECIFRSHYIEMEVFIRNLHLLTKHSCFFYNSRDCSPLLLFGLNRA